MSDTARLILFIICVSALSGCQVRPTEVEEPVVPEQPADEIPDPEIERLLREAQSAYAQDYLTTPVEDNAYLRYMQVLALDPDNVDADHGIADIVEKYLAWAIANARGGSSRKAVDYLNKAKSVDETHPNILSVQALVEDMRSIHRVSFAIAATDLAERTAAVRKQLAEIAGEIERLDATVVIHAPRDSQGRWLYQQLNSYANRRVSATFDYSPSARIVLSY